MVKRKTVTILFLFCVATLLLAGKAWSSGSIQVQLDRDVIEQGESFTARFKSTGDVDGDPDFTPLQKDFEIESQSQSSNIQIINGHMSSSKQWVLVLMPKATGRLVIPSISFGSDKTAPGFITVNKSTASTNSTNHGTMFVEVEATPKNAYVQSQVLYTVRIYHAISLVNASLSDVKLSDKNAMLVSLGDAVSYQKYVNGRGYKVLEKRYAVFPQSSGTLTIEPVQFQGQFVNDYGMLSSRVINSRPVTISVKPEAAAAQNGKNWLPAKSLTVMDSWSQDKPKFQVGEPVTRTITMVADGLMGEQLPPLTFAQIAGLKQYPDQPKITNNKLSSGVTGARQEKVAFIPTHAGVYHLPAMDISWWNTTTNRQEMAKIKAIDINVAPAADQSSSAGTQAQGAAPVVPSTTPSNSSATVNQTLVPTAGKSAKAAKSHTSVWLWVSMGMMVLWLLTLLLWWRQSARTDARSTKYANPQLQKLKPIERELKKVCSDGNAAATKDKLIQWAQANWRHQAPTSLGELGKHCDAELARELMSLSQVLYSDSNSHWDGPSFWRVFSEHKPALNQKKPATVTSLQPLFKNNTLKQGTLDRNDNRNSA